MIADLLTVVVLGVVMIAAADDAGAVIKLAAPTLAGGQTMTKRHAAEIAEIVSNALADICADTDQFCTGLAIVMMQITQEGLRNRNMRRLNADELREALRIVIDSVIDAGIATGSIKREGGQ